MGVGDSAGGSDGDAQETDFAEKQRFPGLAAAADVNRDARAAIPWGGELAGRNGLALRESFEMPANNMMLMFERTR